jgi:hypothetical protein
MSCGCRNPVGLHAGRLYSWVLTWKSAAMLDRGERNTLVSSHAKQLYEGTSQIQRLVIASETSAPMHVEWPATAAV